MTETRRYKAGKDIYEIPVAEADVFVKDFPDAVEVEQFSVEKDTFNIPITEREAFITDFPNAKSVKKKDISVSPLKSATRGETILQDFGLPSKEPIAQPSTSLSTEEQPQEKPFDDAYEAFTDINVQKKHKTGDDVTAENYITAAPQAFNKRMGEAIRNVGAIANLPKNTLSYYINKITGSKDKTSDKFTEAIFKDIPFVNGLGEDKFNKLADIIENAGNPKDIPQNLAGSVLSTLGSVAFDIATVRAMPTTRMNILSKYGMERVPNFPTYLGSMQGVTTAREGGDAGDVALGTAEGLASGLTYEGMGMTAGRVGKLVKDLGANNITSTASRALANSALFEGDTRLKGGEKWTGAVTGLVFAVPEFAGDARRAVSESVAKRAYNTYLTTTNNAIKAISEMNIDPKVERAKSDRLWEEYEAEKDPQKKQELLEEKTTVDNIININGMTKAIIENPQPFINEINKDTRLSEAEKHQWIEKIGNTVRDADPRIKEAKPTIDKINELTDNLNGLNTLYPDPIIRQEKASAIESQIKELRKSLIETLNRPLQDVPKYEMNGKPIEKIDAMNLIAKAEKPEDLEEIKISNDAEVEAMLDKKVGDNLPRTDLAIGKDVFKTKGELFKYLDEKALDKETGKVKQAWLSQEMTDIPNNATLKVISEWESKQKKTEPPKSTKRDATDEEASIMKRDKPIESIEKKSEIKPNEETGDTKGTKNEVKEAIKQEELAEGEGIGIPIKETKESTQTKDDKVVDTQGKTTDKVSQIKPISATEKGEGELKEFIDIINESKTPEEAFKKTSELKDIPTEVSEAFRKKYDPEGKLTPKQAFDKFYKEVKKSPIRKREILRKAVENSNKLDETTKENIIKRGIEYSVRGRKVSMAETKEIIRIADESGGLETIEKIVYDTKSDLQPDTRTNLNIHIAKTYIEKLRGVTDRVERDFLQSRLDDAMVFAGEQGTFYGTGTQAQKGWAEVIGSMPESIVASTRAKLDRDNQIFFKDKKTEVDYVKSVMDEYLNSKDFKSKVEEGIQGEIDKIGTKNWGEESKKKIDSFFNDLLIDPKQQNLYGGLIGIPVAMYNGSMLAVKNALMLGVDLATAIKAGVDYLDKEHKKGFEKGSLESAEWNRDEYIADTKQRLKGLREKVPDVGKAKKGKKDKVKPPPSQEELVDKLFAKVAKIATRKQLSDFVVDYMQEIADKGVVNDPRFRAILAKALGRDYITEQTEAKITNAAKALSEANKRADDYAKSMRKIIDEYEKIPEGKEGETKRKSELKRLTKEAREEKKKWDKSVFKAEQASQSIKEALSKQPDLVDRIGTLIQGNLLVPGSQLANIYGNLLVLPYTGPSYMVSGLADALFTSMLKGAEKLTSKINPVKHPDLYHLAKALPSPERSVLPMAYTRGYFENVWPSVKTGLKQLKTGALTRDLGKGDVQRGINPIKAVKDLFSKDRAFARRIGDLLEALPAGYAAEAQFRLLNVGDKPFRGGAEGGRLSEQFETYYKKQVSEARKIENKTERENRVKFLKDSKETARKQFMAQPDFDVLSEARQAGDIATFAQDTPISEIISKFGKKGGDAETEGIKAWKSIMRIAKITNLPYVKIPINLTMLSAELTAPPLLFAKLMAHSIGYAKEPTASNQRKIMDDIGRMAIGTMLSVGAQVLAKNGIITTLSDDPKERAAQLDAGVEEGRVNLSALNRLLKGEDPTYQDGDDLRSVKRLGVVSVMLMSHAQAYKEKTPEQIEKMADNPVRNYVNSMFAAMPYMPKMALEQSILAGISTLLQAGLGGEMELDRWLSSQAKILSTILYPSTIGAISQATDPEGFLRETRDLSTEDGRIKKHIVNIFKDRMFMGKNLPAKVTLWGEPVRRIPEGEKWSYHLFGITKQKKYQKYSFGTKLLEAFQEYQKIDPDEAKKMLPTIPSASTKVGWDDARMTTKELEQYQMNVGRERAQETENYMNSTDWDDDNLEEKNRTLAKIYRDARKTAEAEMFSWINYKDGSAENKSNWEFMLKNNALPIPNNSKRLGDYRLTPQEVEQLNNMALTYYDDYALTLLKENPEAVEQLRALETDSGKSKYLETLNGYWKRSVTLAKRQILPIVRQARLKSE